MYIKTLTVVFLIGISFFIVSCGDIKYITMVNHDPWEDESEIKVANTKGSEKTPNTEEKLQKIKEEFIDLPDIYEVSCNISVENADLQLRSELEERNYKIIKVSYVTRGMKEQGRTDFWEDMRIYMICRLSDGYYILRHNPWLVGMCPLRIYTYRNEEGKLVIGTFRPSLSAKWMGNPDLQAYKVLKTYDKEFKEILDNICEE